MHVYHLIQALFELCDVNSDGKISKDEFSSILAALLKYKGAITTASGKVFKTLEEAREEFFSLLDLDADGEISLADYQLGAQKNPEIVNLLSII